MTLHEFLERAGLADRTLRLYHQQGLVPPAAADGHYGEVHWLRVMAVPLLRGQGIRGPGKLRRALDAMSIEDLRHLVAEDGEGDAFAGDDDAVFDATSGPVPALTTPARQTRASLGETHVHVTLKEGIVLDVRMPLDEEGQALVEKIASICGLRASFGQRRD